MQLTAQQVYDRLLKTTKIVGEKGHITFSLKGYNIKITGKDTVGNLMQEWFKEWLVREKIDFTEPANTQDFPDFNLDKKNPMNGLLEVKSFDWERTPNFDVAAFLAYRRSLVQFPYRLDSNYLIFGYSMNGHTIEIKDVWLKKVWEMTGPSGKWPLKCNVKQGDLFNIRPVKWYKRTGRKDRSPKLPIFKSALDFVTAFDGNQRMWGKTARDILTNTWLNDVKIGYAKATGSPLV